MAGTAKKTDPKLWDKVKARVTKGAKGGKPGQWSARKAQLAVGEYKKDGGGYEGQRSADNHLRQWTEEEWGTKSGKRSEDTGERYLPKKAREKLDQQDYARTSAKKRRDTAKGRRFSRQPADVAQKTKPYRAGGTGGGSRATKARLTKVQLTKAQLYERAKARDIQGRSRMSRAELERALG